MIWGFLLWGFAVGRGERERFRGRGERGGWRGRGIKVGKGARSAVHLQRSLRGLERLVWWLKL